MKKTEVYSYENSNGVILLPGKVSGLIGERAIRLVFDPGAHRTILATMLTDYLGYKATHQSKRVTTSSVAGKEYGYTLIIQKLTVLSFEFSNVEVASFDLPERYGIDGLLGLDLLEQFEITLRHRERWIQFQRLD